MSYNNAQRVSDLETISIVTGNTLSKRIANRGKFLPKKCWICQAVVQLEDSEYISIQEYFFNQNLDFVSCENNSDNDSRNSSRTNEVRLILLKNKFVITDCKCKKKLAHLNCFNNFIDLKQNGNPNVEILCSKCNFKFLFEYPHNGKLHYLSHRVN